MSEVDATEADTGATSPASLQRRLLEMKNNMDSAPPGPMGEAFNALGRGMKILGGGMKEMVTGDKRKTGDFSEFGPTTMLPPRMPETDMAPVQPSVAPTATPDEIKQSIATSFGLASAQDPLGYANVVQNWVPGAKVTFDVNNNPLIKWQGKTYYANKPGVSGNDFLRLASDMLEYAPASKWASTGKTLLGRMGKQAIAAPITDLLQQLGGQALGTKEDLNLWSPAFAGMAGVGSEALAPFLSQGANMVWNRLGRGVITDAHGNPTPFGRSFVEQVGLDADGVTAGMWKTLDKYYRALDSATKSAMQTAAADATQATAQAARGPVNAAMEAADPSQTIPKTLGQQTRNQAQLDFEEMARTGRAGQGARDTMQGFDGSQSRAVMDRAKQMQNMASMAPAQTPEQAAAAAQFGTPRGSTPDNLGGVIAGGVQDREAAAWKGVGDAYAAVPDGVRLSAEPLLAVPNAAAQKLRMMGIFPDRAGFDTVYPRTSKALADIRGVMAEKMALPLSKRSFGLMELEQERRAVNQLIDGADGSDQKALLTIKSTFDDYINKTWDDALLKGDPTALAQLKLARQARTEYAQMFEPKDVDKTVSNTINKMVNQRDIDNNQVVNWIFGTSEAGFPKAGLQMTKQLGKIFGTSSDEYAALREAAMMKILYGSSASDPMMKANLGRAIERPLSNATGGLLNRMDNYLDLQGSAVMKELFSKPELDQLRRFRYELRQIQPGANAPTLKTGASMALWMSKVGSWVDGAIRMKAGGLPISPVGAASEVAQGWGNNARAQASIGGWQPPEVRSIPLFNSLITGAGASGGGYVMQPGPGQQPGQQQRQ